MPTVTAIPQWTWTLTSENITVVTLNNLTPGFDFYYTTRPTGETAPTVIAGKTRPDDAIKAFRMQSTNKNSVNNQDEFVIESQVLIDVYTYSFSRDNTVTTDGQLLVKNGQGNSLPVNPVSGGVDVSVQDQTTPTIIQKFNQVTNSTTLAAQPALYDYDVEVVSNTGIIIGTHLILFSPDLIRFTSFDVLGVAGTTISLDAPVDAEYPIGTFVDVTFTDMSVNGSVTPQVFGLRGLGVVPGLDIAVDITRIIFTCLTDSPVTLALFGDIARLTKGLLLRNRNGETFNIFNVKDNLEIAGIMLDWIPYSTLNPAQGQNGFTARLTFTKLGVVQRLHSGEDLEFVVQDDLLVLDTFEVVAEGHIVD